MANPNVEAAYFWAQIGQNETNKKYKVKGSDFPNVAKGPEMVWVQRGDDHYWTWYGQPNDLDNPDYSYRFNYFIEGFNEGLPGDQRNQPDGDGVINLSLYFSAPGPYPVTEWKNIRNRQNVIKDLDNKEFTLYQNPDLKEGDVCRITHEGSDFEAWYIVETGSNKYVQFKTLYQKSEDDSRPRTDVKRTGRRPNPDGTQVLRFDFYAKENAKPYNRIADDDWVWAEKEGVKYKVSGENFKGLFDPTITLSGTQVYKSTLDSLTQHDFMPVLRANATSSTPFAETTLGIKAIELNNVRLDQYVNSNIDNAKITITQQSNGTKRLEGDVTSIQIPTNQTKNEVYIGFTPTFAPAHSWTNSNYTIEITGIEP